MNYKKSNVLVSTIVGIIVSVATALGMTGVAAATPLQEDSSVSNAPVEQFYPDESQKNGLQAENGQSALAQQSSPCVYRSRVDNPHISSTSPGRGVQAHGWWDLEACASSNWKATVKVGLMAKVGGSWVDIGSQGTKTNVNPGGGSANRATAHQDCWAGKTYQYKAWVDVDVIGAWDPSDLVWSNVVTLSC